MQNPKEFLTLVEAYRAALASYQDAQMDAQSWAHDNEDFFTLMYDLMANEKADPRHREWRNLQNAESATREKMVEIEESIMEMVRNPEITTALQANMIVKQRNVEDEFSKLGKQDTNQSVAILHQAKMQQAAILMQQMKAQMQGQFNAQTQAQLNHIGQFQPKKRKV